MPIHIADPYKSSTFAERQTGLLFNLPLPAADVVQLPAGISLCMIVKNEERFLEECLESVKHFVDEINIVDTGSTDRTLEIARKYTDRIEHREWRNDFAWARNESLNMATKRWVLVLDADEELTADSGSTLAALANVPADVEPVYIRISNLVDDESGAGKMTHLLPRIYPNTPRIRYHGVIHENIGRVDANVEMGGVLSPIRIIHKGYMASIIAGRKKSERNLPLLAKAVEENAEHSFAWFNYGMSAIGAEEIDRGVAAFEKMFEIDERTGIVRSYHALAYLALAAAYAYRRDDIEKGLATVEKCLAVYDDYSNAHFTKGDILMHAKRYEEARVCLKRAIETRANVANHYMVDDEIFQWKAQYNIALTYLRSNEPEKAAEWFGEALVNKPESVLIRRQRARALERAGKLFDAEVGFRDLFEHRNGDDAVVVDYVDFLIRRGRNSRALEVVESSLPTVHPDFVIPLQIGAGLITYKAKLGDPIRYLEPARTSAPGNSSVIQLLETIYLERNDTAALNELLERELETSPETPRDFARRSHRYLKMSRFEDARASALTGLEIAPGNGILLYNAAVADVKLGDVPAASKKLERITSDTPEVYPTSLFLRAQLAGDDLDAALVALDELESYEPHNVDGLLLRSEKLEHAGRFTGAERVLREVMKAGEERIGVALAGLLMRAGRNEEAAAVATLALSGT